MYALVKRLRDYGAPDSHGLRHGLRGGDMGVGSGEEEVAAFLNLLI